MLRSDNLKEKFIKFMQGRYGADQLSQFLSYINLILILVALFTKESKLYYVIFVLLFLQNFRMFSKNITARYNENQKFLTITSPIRRFFTRTTRNVKDKDYKYIKCEKCNQELRVPKKKGKIQVTCKNCKNKFQIRT